MCDTIAVPGSHARASSAWLAKNSDREGDEAQHTEVVAARSASIASQRCTALTIPGAPAAALIVSRPTWMWGAEMGVNEHGLAIGNQAVFTRLPVAAWGLSGMDLVRLALERARSAAGGVEVLVALLADHGQGGPCSLTDPRFRYHNAFLLQDRREAWWLETAGPYWAAARVEAPTTISNGLRMGPEASAMHPQAQEEAYRRGWWDGERPFSFSAAFEKPMMSFLAGARERQACTMGQLRRDWGGVSDLTLRGALRDHGASGPRGGWRLSAPCSHSSALPTRLHGQTTASMVVRLDPGLPAVLSTGTPAPCLGVFKPVSWETPGVYGGIPGLKPDTSSLFWRAERVHRVRLRRWSSLGEAWRPACADALEAEALKRFDGAVSAADARELWEADGERWAGL